MKYPYQSAAPKRNIGSDKIFFWVIGGLTLLALVFIFIYSLKEQKQTKIANVSTYASTDLEKPSALVSTSFSDMGTIKVSQEKAVDFNIENKGNKPLQLFNITSSCGCTLGTITIGGKTSPEFGMHSKSTWSGELPAGEKAQISVIYRPYIMPVKGEVTREVYVSTNDPENKLLTFTVKANVQ